VTINPYLSFNGNAEEALHHYQDVLGGELNIMRYEGSPAAVMAPPDWANKVLHGALTSSAGTLMASDATTDRVKNPGDNFTISIVTADEAEADRVFTKLAEGGQVLMPLAPAFWGAKFGMLVDRFKIQWMVNCG